jgi:hypothetical protein
MAFDAAKPWSPEIDPIVTMLLREEATTAHEAECRYLDSHIADIVALVNSPLSEAEFRRHPLIMMLFAHGSREWGDSLV